MNTVLKYFISLFGEGNFLVDQSWVLSAPKAVAGRARSC